MISMSASPAPAEPEVPQERVPLYESSTQFKNWRFSVAQLAQTRATLNVAAVAVIRTKIETDQVRLISL